ncbi:hypothetical protein QTP70_007000 [Hemibagrus guttatus]|uniref:Endonuclease/exonuclease/phosphatase domain-containing protein n=1 Tax=Hemibagrus guttatus TaxID=175788 RepID=A0AAE0V681_9TELE|nr:hypothetical protein QTP70_007000 [Hemibagrus guttatus]
MDLDPTPGSQADMMERRKVDILCVQETRWKGSKARSIGAGFKLFHYGVDSKRNGVGVVLKEEFVRNVLEVKRVSDRVMSLKLEIEGVMLNVVSGYAPQVGCELEEKERFWSELDEVMESIPMGERVVIGADFNGHVGEGNTGDEEVMGKFGVKERNLEGQMVVDFAKRMDMAVVNTYFQKREEHRVTYKSGVMDQLSEEVRQESPWTMMFADDIVICSESREQVEENLERWRFALERRGMKVSRSGKDGLVRVWCQAGDRWPEVIRPVWRQQGGSSLAEDCTQIVVVSGDGAKVRKGLVDVKSRSRNRSSETMGVTVSAPVQYSPAGPVDMGVVLPVP